MATEFINGQWRIPNSWNVDESNQGKISNYSMDFNGTSDKIGFGNINGFEITDSFSGSCWVNLDTLGANYFISKQLNSSPFTGYIFSLRSDNKLQFFIAESLSSNILVNSDETLSVNTWYNLAFTYDGSNSGSGVKLYINGTLTALNVTNTGTITTILNAAPFQVSGRGGTAGNVDGRIDQVSVFNYELTQAQIDILYGNSAAGYFQIGNPMALTPNPVAFYPLGDQDLIGAGYNGANWLVPNQVTGNGFNSVFNFNGSQLINLNNAEDGVIAGTTSFTISAWIKATSTGAGQSLFGNFGGGSNVKCFTLGILDSTPPANPVNDGALNFLIFTTANVQHQALVSGANGITFGIWQHVSMTYDTNDLKVFINGVQKQSTSVSNVTLNTSEFADVIGRRSTGNNPYYTGQVSNVAFWRNVVQNPVALYNNGATGDLTSLNPTSWYKLNSSDVFDSGTGNWTIKDYGSRGEDGTSDGMTSSSLVNSDLPSSTSGYSPYAIDLDGTDETFVVDNSSEDFNLDYLSISMWFNPDVDANQTIINNCFFTSGNMGWGIKLSPDKRIRFISVRTGEKYVTGQEYNPGEWNHIAVTYDNATGLTLYLNNGTPVNYQIAGSGGNAPLIYTSGSLIRTGVTIGSAAGSGSVASPGPPSQFFNGKLSNVAVWSSGLSTAQVATIYNNGIPGDISSLNPLAWWELGSMMGFNGVDTYTALSNTNTNYAAVSTANMAGGNVVNGPGYSEGGNGTSSLVIEKQAPFSFNNALSESMAISNRDDSQANDPYPLIFELDLTGETSSYNFITPIMSLGVTYPFTVDWGDGSVETILNSTFFNIGRLSHTYDTDTYPRPVVQVGKLGDAGQVVDFRAADGGSRLQVYDLKQFGQANFLRLDLRGTSASGLTPWLITASDNLKFAGTTFASIFAFTSKANPSTINSWDISTVLIGTQAFYHAKAFNQDLNNWDTSSIRPGESEPGISGLTALTFTTNTVFNGDVSNWFTTKSTSMNQMFSGCTVFNRDVSTKYISAANSPTGSAYVAWDTKNITNFSTAFFNARAFNQDISNWDTSSGTNISVMFSGANAFNQDISTKQVTVNGVTYTAWDVSNVTNMFGMLNSTAFNNTLDNWELNAGLTSVSQMFIGNNTISDANFSDNWAIFANSVKDDNSGSGGAASGFPKGVNATFQNNNAQIKVNRSAPTSTGGVPHFATISRALSSLTSDVQITVNEEDEESKQEYTANFLDTANSSYPTELVGVINSDYTFNWNGSEWEFKKAGTLVETDQGSATLQAGPDEGVWNLTVVKLNAGWNFSNTGTVYS